MIDKDKIAGESSGSSAFEARSRAAFDASVDSTNATVRSHLTQARYAAVAQLEQQTRSPAWRLWAPAAALSAALLIAVLIVLPNLQSNERSADATFASDDLPMLLDSDSELIEDLDFYAWLGEAAVLDDDSQSIDATTTAEPARS